MSRKPIDLLLSSDFTLSKWKISRADADNTKLKLSVTNWAILFVKSASYSVYNDNKETGPVLRDLHILRKEWQNFSKQSPQRPSLGDQRWLGVAPLSKVLRVSTLKAFLTSAQETGLSIYLWPHRCWDYYIPELIAIYSQADLWQNKLCKSFQQ